VPGRTHGLRKAGAATAAENGATTKQLMAIFGWLSVEEAERYTQAAERKRMLGTRWASSSRGGHHDRDQNIPTQHPHRGSVGKIGEKN